MLSRGGAGHELGAVEVRKVMDSCITLAWTEVRHRARLVKEYGDVPPVLANESRLGPVFLDLLVNAAHAIPEGHGSDNEIRIVTRLEPDGRVLVEVCDTGAGIPEAVRNRLFDPFPRTLSSTESESIRPLRTASKRW